MKARLALPFFLLLAAPSAFGQASPQAQTPQEPVKPPAAPAVPPKASVSPVGAGYTLIPLPAFSYNRNEGTWVGALAPLFRANDQGEVEDIFAPLYLHNDKIGETLTMNYFGYREHSKQYHAVVSHATKIERTVDLSYRDSAAGNKGRFVVYLKADSGKSAFNRFYGLGPRTTDDDETIHSLGDSNIKLAGGLNLPRDIVLVFQERYRDVSLENGATDTLPQTLDKFPTTPGVHGADVWGQSLSVQHDTRDNSLTPLRGDLLSATVEYDQDFQTARHGKWARLTGEGRVFLPHRDDRAVFVVHGLIDAAIGEVARRVPFYERPTLGGESSLRGYGRGRFISNTAVLLNLEERLSLARKAIMGNLIELEVSPFLDIGRTAPSLDSDGWVRFMRFNPGVGVRVLARPNIAGRLDLAWGGSDGANVFVGLDYPF